MCCYLVVRQMLYAECDDFCKLCRVAVKKLKGSFAYKVGVKDSWFTQDDYKDIIWRVSSS